MENLIRKLNEAPEGLDDYVDYLYEILDYEPIGEPTTIFQHAFRFFETHQEADLGTPGPLVHFLENYYPKYIEQLCQSIVRRPTHYTVWMINRILNAKISEETRNQLLDSLRLVTEHPSANESTKNEALRFLDLHTT